MMSRGQRGRNIGNKPDDELDCTVTNKRSALRITLVLEKDEATFKDILFLQ